MVPTVCDLWPRGIHARMVINHDTKVLSVNLYFRRLARSLGEVGEIEPETEGMLIENGVDFDEFPDDAIACLPQNVTMDYSSEGI